MTERFFDTEAGLDFIATADSRNTSPEVMKAIAFFATDLDEAERRWNGVGLGQICHLSDIWENATSNGAISDTALYWGDRTLAAVMVESAAA